MTNAEQFKKTFGIYAEEFWSYTGKQMLVWINTDVPDTNVGDMISRQAAIDAFRKELCRERVYATPFISFKGCERILNELPSERRINMIEETFVIYVNGAVIARNVPQYMLTDIFDAAVRHFAALPEMSIRVEHTKKED